MRLKARRANGMAVKIPAANWRIKPARSNNWWLALSASEGGSRKVWLNRWDILIKI
jgi:hypothetical protein